MKRSVSKLVFAPWITATKRSKPAPVSMFLCVVILKRRTKTHKDTGTTFLSRRRRSHKHPPPIERSKHDDFVGTKPSYVVFRKRQASTYFSLSCQLQSFSPLLSLGPSIPWKFIGWGFKAGLVIRLLPS